MPLIFSEAFYVRIKNLKMPGLRALSEFSYICINRYR